MTLNEAIREGCRLRGEYRDGWFDGEGNCCAVGAAYVGAIDPDASLMNRSENWRDRLIARFPELTRIVPGMKETTVLGWISVLHLHMKWSREAIAEWADPHPELHLSIPTLTTITRARSMLDLVEWGKEGKAFIGTPQQLVDEEKPTCP